MSFRWEIAWCRRILILILCFIGFPESINLPKSLSTGFPELTPSNVWAKTTQLQASNTVADKQQSKQQEDYHTLAGQNINLY